jgi:hypothetical protein
VGLRRRMRQLERRAEKGLSSFELRDGSTYRYDLREVGLELFAYGLDQDADLERVEFYRMLKEAKDPRAAVEPLRPRGSTIDETWLDPVVLAEEIIDSRQTHEDRF